MRDIIITSPSGAGLAIDFALCREDCGCSPDNITRDSYAAQEWARVAQSKIEYAIKPLPVAWSRWTQEQAGEGLARLYITLDRVPGLDLETLLSYVIDAIGCAAEIICNKFGGDLTGNNLCYSLVPVRERPYYTTLVGAHLYHKTSNALRADRFWFRENVQR